MTPVFADTFFFFALINPRDAAHRRALAAAEARSGPVFTTAWVLTELADGLAASRDRGLLPAILAGLEQEPRITVIPPSQELFERGLGLYVSRPDKAWSLTDCVSFIVMEEWKITEALTADHHFEQAGFIALLK